jgi:3-oxoacyl-[acyl-carrier-protein] synthase II
MITPLGRIPEEVLGRIRNNESAAIEPFFETCKFDCPVFAPVPDFNAEDYFPDNKTLRFMNRDARMAVAAAALAMDDAGVKSDETYRAEEIGLYGSTGVAGMSVEEITRIIRYAAREDGGFDLERFGREALRRVRPVLSFKILANMPICFVSIFQNIKGPNAVYTPWEGHGAHAIVSGIRAIRQGKVPCALVGGCDVKTRELSFINLQQTGVFESWKRFGTGCIPAEGAAFLVLEDEEKANKRGRKAYARITEYQLGSTSSTTELDKILFSILSKLKTSSQQVKLCLSGDGDFFITESEGKAIKSAGFKLQESIKPKSSIGNLFAAAAALQVGLAAVLNSKQTDGEQVAANCFGFGSEQAAFLLESACIE